QNILFGFNWLAVHLDQVIAFANVYGRLIERSTDRAGDRRIGHRAIDLFETILSVCDLVVSAEEADAITGSRGRWSIAAANVEVADGYGAQHLLHQPVKVAATNNRWQVRGEFVFKSDEILTMMIRIVKPVAHDPHRFMEHLTPFLGRIDTNFHLTEVLPALVWFCGSVS